jgi:serine phosphatase RsbU (regulator of sigma subunit)
VLFGLPESRGNSRIRTWVSLFSGISQRTVVTLTLVVVITAAFGYATYLSYYAGRALFDAFGYQRAVVYAQRDLSDLQVQQFDLGATPEELAPYVNILQGDLNRIDGAAQTASQRAPRLKFPASRSDYSTFTNELVERQNAGVAAFNATVEKNTQTRNVSNALFAIVALLFAVLVGRLRRTIEEGRSLVEGLQRAFISTRRSIPYVDLGSVLISATRGSNVGGDTHDAFTFDRRHGLFLVADVSGKGIDAAVDTALIKYTIRTLFSEDRDPGTMLTKFATIYALTTEKPETFVVLFVAVVDLETGMLHYASAGHEPAWAIRAGAVEELPPTGPIVGIEDEENYETRSFRLAPGDALVVSTDGLTESRDSRGRLLGADAVREWLAELSGSAQAMADAIVRRLRKRSSRITDDLAILIVRYDPSRVPGTPSEAGAKPALSAVDSNS